MKVTSKCPQCGHGIEHFNGVYVGMLWCCPKCRKEWPVTKEEETTSQADESVDSLRLRRVHAETILRGSP